MLAIGKKKEGGPIRSLFAGPICLAFFWVQGPGNLLGRLARSSGRGPRSSVNGETPLITDLETVINGTPPLAEPVGWGPNRVPVVYFLARREST